MMIDMHYLIILLFVIIQNCMISIILVIFMVL